MGTLSIDGKTLFTSAESGLVQQHFRTTHREFRVGGIDAPVQGTTNPYDDAESGQFVIYEKENKIWSITDTGYVSTPNIPAFYAYRSGGYAIESGNFPFNEVRLNNGNHYDTLTYRFSAPIKGIYCFLATALHRQFTTNSSAEITFFKNDATINSRGFGYSYFGQTSSNYHEQVFTSLTIDLEPGDYITFGIHSNSGDWYYGDNLGYFSGHLLG